MVLAGSAPVLFFPRISSSPGTWESQSAWETHFPEMSETTSTRCDDARDKTIWVSGSL